MDKNKSWSDRGNVANRRIKYACEEGNLQKLPSGRYLATDVLRWMHANWPTEYRAHPTIKYGSAAALLQQDEPMPTTLDACHEEIAALRDRLSALKRERIQGRLTTPVNRAAMGGNKNAR